MVFYSINLAVIFQMVFGLEGSLLSIHGFLSFLVVSVLILSDSSISLAVWGPLTVGWVINFFLPFFGVGRNPLICSRLPCFSSVSSLSLRYTRASVMSMSSKVTSDFSMNLLILLAVSCFSRDPC